jgi:acyl carrier protein
LPRTEGGKINRRALPASVTRPDRSYTAPRDKREAALAEAYAAVLALDHVGVDDNFFDLGGGSIQILEIIVRAQSLGLTLTPELFFQYQTIAELVAAHDQAETNV